MAKEAVANRMTSKKRKIVVKKDGPYLVTGGLFLEKEIIINDENGDALEWIDRSISPNQESNTRNYQRKRRNFYSNVNQK